MSASQPDQREHRRAPIELMVQYRRLNLFFADYTRNISKGGTFIKTEKPLPVGTEFRFKLHVPNRAEPFELSGHVVWVNDGGQTRPEAPERGMAIRFIPTVDNNAFTSEVEGMMQASLGRELSHKLISSQATDPKRGLVA